MRVTIEIDGEASGVEVDRNELIKNLLEKDIQHAQQGSTLHIRIENHESVERIFHEELGIPLKKVADST